METKSDIRRRLAALKFRLEQTSRAWTVEDYWAVLKFYSEILPRLIPSERCTIFIIEIGEEKICSIIGTGLEKMRIEPPKDKSVVGKVISSGKSVIVNDIDDAPGYHITADARTGFQTRNMICAPIVSVTGHGITGAIQVLNCKETPSFSDDDLQLLDEIAVHLSVSIESIIVNREILRISRQLNREVERYDRGFFRDTPFIAESPAMKEILEQVRMLATTPVGVLIQGDNGVGKEVIARMIHEESARRDHPFIAVNCASIPRNLMESEFFGFEKGAFTGADSARKGYFEESEKGTLFLDEIGDMPLAIQPKFLRAIQEGEGYRLGGKRLIQYNFRVICATNKDLKDEVKKKNFREDLYFRLFSVEIWIPPLKNRVEDIAPMAFAFLEEVSRRFDKKTGGFSTKVLDLFNTYDWPGNVRQLRREVERVVALTPEGEKILPDKCSPDLLRSTHAGKRNDDDGFRTPLPEQVQFLEMEQIRKALKQTGGNRSRTAKLLGISRQGLHKKMIRYGLRDD